MQTIKVLHFHGGMKMGGTESVIMNLYRNIDREKYKFDFTTTFNEKCDYDDEINELGGNIFYIPSRQEVGQIGHIKEIIKLLKINKYDVIHTHMNFHGGIVAMLAKILGVKKVICHAHNSQDDAKGIKRLLEIKFLRILINLFADDCIACGIEAGNFVFGKKSKFILLNNSVDLARFNPNNKIQKYDYIEKLKKDFNLNDKLILGHIGRFSKQKNHDFIIGIMETLEKRNINFKFIFIGEGELKDKFIEKLKNKNLYHRALFLGLVKDPEIWLNIFDELIFPSLYEGLPVALIEAQASGTISIISKNISPNVDMELGLIKFLEINNNYNEWVNSILSLKNIKIVDVNTIKNKMDKKGYSLNGNINLISSIYSEGRQ